MSAPSSSRSPAFIELYVGPGTVLSGRAFSANGGGVAFCPVPLHVKIPMGFKPAAETRGPVSYLLFCQPDGSTYFLTGATSRFHSGTGAGSVLAMSQREQEAWSVQLGFNRDAGTVSLNHASLGVFTLDTRGYGMSFQPAMPENRPPLLQHFRYKIVRESGVIRSLATRLVLTCIDSRPGAPVIAMPDGGSEKRLWQIDDLHHQIIHQATGYVLDISPGHHGRLCINPPEATKDSQQWLFKDGYLICRKNTLVATSHDIVGSVTAEPRDQNGSAFQKWRLDSPASAEAPSAPNARVPLGETAPRSEHPSRGEQT